MEVIVKKDDISIWNYYKEPVKVLLFGSPFTIGANSMLHYQKNKK